MSKAYEVVTERIVKMLESGTIPWKKSWSEGAGLGDHQNLISQHQYRGINAMVTSAQGYAEPYWLTFKQAADHGGTIRKGEKGTPIVYWQFGTKENSDGEEKRFALARYSTVFNIAQVDGMDSVKALIEKKRKQKRIDFSPIAECEKIVASYKGKPAIQHLEQRAYYRPAFDVVNMPVKDSFTSVEEYYAVLFHELAHSTGHQSRLGREGITEKNYFGSHKYSKEELVAEMGAAFLCAKAGINAATEENSAAYIQSWLKVLKNDSKLLMQAASAAQKAADLIQGIEAPATKE